MNPAKIQTLGNSGYSRSIHPLNTVQTYQGDLVGFDTEYTSKGNELISFQLWTKKGGKFFPVKRNEKLTPDRLLVETMKLLGYCPAEVCFITYFSLAELQFLPVITEGFNLREYANGSLDVDFSASWKGQTACLSIFDLARWFERRSLASVAASQGLAKKKYDTKHVTRKCLESKIFRSYAVHDAYLCYEITKRLREKFTELATVDMLMAKTPANISSQVFRRLFVKKDETICCDIDAARRIALHSAWGGRAEVFHRGKLPGSYFEYDFKSAYPTSCLRIGEFPCQGSWKPIKKLSHTSGMLGGFVHASFSFPNATEYPCLPVWSKDRLLFPINGETWCTLYEIQEAINIGCHVKLIEAWGYKHGTKILSDYMALVIEKRKTAEGMEKYLWKLLGNSLTGKFAQCCKRVSISEYERLAKEIGTTLDDVMGLNKWELAALGVKSSVNVGPVFMPEWYALITGWTRAALSQMLISSKAVYCHTDSVWANQEPICNRLVFEKKTNNKGQSISGDVEIIRTRFARIGQGATGHTARHSIHDAKVADEMLEKFTGENFQVKYSKHRPMKLKESIRRKKLLGQWIPINLLGDTQWDGKRELLPNGNTIPWQDAAAFESWRKKEGLKPLIYE